MSRSDSGGSPSSPTAAASASASAPQSVPAWASLVSGSVAGCVSRLFIAPLDVLKIRMQVAGMSSGPPAVGPSASLRSTLRSLLREEGWTALWKGNWAAEAMVVPYAAVAFVSYSVCQEALRPLLPGSSLSPLLSGSVSGLCATLATYPLDLLRTRFAAQHSQRAEYASLPQAVRRILSSDGVRGLYRGLPAALLGIVPLMAVQFQLYESCKTAVSPAAPLSALQQSSCGFVSGVLSKLATMPLDVIKKRCQVQRFAHFKQPGQQAAAASLTLLDAAVSIWRREGLPGLYRGSLPSLVKAGPNAAVLYLVYEQTMQRLLPQSSTRT